jgi:hypothetical protein
VERQEYPAMRSPASDLMREVDAVIEDLLDRDGEAGQPAVTQIGVERHPLLAPERVREAVDQWVTALFHAETAGQSAEDLLQHAAEIREYVRRRRALRGGRA